jgi:hypothetical protein
MAVSETPNVQKEYLNCDARRRSSSAPDRPSASDRHFSGRLKVDISSMRQQVTEAQRNAISLIDSPKGLCKDRERQTYQRSK